MAEGNTISDLQIRVAADPSQAKRDLGTINTAFEGTEKAAEKAATKAEGFGSRLSGALGGALKSVTGGLLTGGFSILSGAASDFFSGAIDEAKGWNAAMAQTEAVVKSTGGAAGLSAAQMGDLAASLSGANGMSMASDDAVLAGENMLATFTNIGKTVFPQATATALDMAAAFGGDAKSQSLALGKALNDPVKGVGALSRVGVTFTEQQKEQIKAMVAVGDTAGAQRVILAELNKEVGGSAKAAADADGGAFRLSEQFANLKQTVGDALLPILKQAMGFLASDQVMGVLQGVADLVAHGLSGGFEVLKGVLGQVGGWLAGPMQVLGDFGTLLADAFSSKSAKLDLLQKLPGWLQPIGKIVADTVGNFSEFFDALGKGENPLKALGDLIKNNLVDLLGNLGLDKGGVSGFIDGLTGALGQAKDTFVTFATGAQTALGQVGAFIASPGVQGVLTTLKDLIVTGLGQAWAGVSAAWNAAVPVATQLLNDLGTALTPLKDAVGTVIGLFGAGGFAGVMALVSGQIGTTNPVLQTLQGVFQALQPVIEAAQNIWANLSTQFGTMAAQIMPQLQQAWANIQPGIEAIGPALEKIGPIIGTLGGIVAGVLGGVVATTFSLVVGIVNGFIAALPGLGTAFSGVFEVIGGVVQTFWSLISGIWNLLSDLFTGNFDAMGGHLQGAFQGMADGIGQIVGGLWDTVRGLFQAGYDFVVGLAQGFWTTITGIWTGISDALVGHSIITDMIAKIGSVFQGLWDTLTGIVKGIWDGVTHWFTQTAIDVYTKVTGMRDQALAVVGALKDKAVELVKNLAIDAVVHALKLKDDIVAKVTGLKDDALALFTTFKDQALSFLGDLVTGAIAKALEIHDAVVNKVTELKDGALALWSELKDKALGFLTGLVDEGKRALDGAIEGFKTIGTNIMNGLLGTISAGKDAIINKIKEIAGGALDAIKEFFGIQSPSTVMAGVGENIIAGLAGGLLGHQGVLAGAVGQIGTGLEHGFQAMQPGIVGQVQTLAGTLAQALLTPFAGSGPAPPAPGKKAGLLGGITAMAAGVLNPDSPGAPGSNDTGGGLGAQASAAMADVFKQLAALVDYQAEPRNEDSLVNRWFRLVGLLGTKLDSGPQSLKAYASAAMRSVLDLMLIQVDNNFPAITGAWAGYLNGLKALVDDWVQAVNSAFAEVKYPSPPDSTPPGQTPPATQPPPGKSGGGGGGGGGPFKTDAAIYGAPALAGAGSTNYYITIGGISIAPDDLPAGMGEFLVKLAQHKQTRGRGLGLPRP